MDCPFFRSASRKRGLMYTIIVNSDNELVLTQKEVITKGSKLVDKIHFLVDPAYKDVDMTDYSVVLEYVSPISKAYKTINLTKSDELYKEMIEYVIPVDTDITKEAGDVEIKLTFSKADPDPDTGEMITRVRKTQSCKIHITDIASWDDFVPDSALSALDQRIASLNVESLRLREIADRIVDKDEPIIGG